MQPLRTLEKPNKHFKFLELSYYLIYRDEEFPPFPIMCGFGCRVCCWPSQEKESCYDHHEYD